MKIITTSLIIFGCLFSLKLAAQKDEIFVNEDLQLVQYLDSIFIYIIWHESESFGRFSSNGLVVVKNGQAIILDTPMTNAKTKTLVEYLKDSMHIQTKKLIIGHFHDDCLGGLDYIQESGIESIANEMTVNKCRDLGLTLPSSSFSDSLSLSFNGLVLECVYFGRGHSFDNITVWIPSIKTLFGGCLIKSLDAVTLGNLSDAFVDDWDDSLNNILATYKNIKNIIPGHGSPGGPELIYHTIELVEDQ